MLLIAWTADAHAAQACYDTRGFPSVRAFEPHGDGFRAYLDPGNVYPMPKVATLTYSQARGFGQGERRTLPKDPHAGALDSCAASARSALEINEKVSACTRNDGAVWFGLGYYSGEGETGLGGLGRYDPASGALELRRPELIRKASATGIAVFGDRVWLGTSGFHECIGLPPKVGLVVYDWNSGGVRAYQGGSNVCGFVVHDLYPVGESLWVATDMGLTLVRDAGARRPTFENYVPDPASPSGIKKVTCDELYRGLLASLSSEQNMLGESPLYWFVGSLVAHSPRFAERTLRELVLEKRAPSGVE